MTKQNLYQKIQFINLKNTQDFNWKLFFENLFNCECYIDTLFAICILDIKQIVHNASSVIIKFLLWVDSWNWIHFTLKNAILMNQRWSQCQFHRSEMRIWMGDHYQFLTTQGFGSYVATVAKYQN